MIVYDTKNWGNTLIKIYLSFSKAYTTRILFRDIIYVTIYTAAVVVLDLAVLPNPIHIDPLFFSLLGVILSLMLVFRLNSSYSNGGKVAKPGVHSLITAVQWLPC
ncbi:MAG: bestrophin [Bacteroidia bacterium]|nr:bestrophin [Bacteroidia bacterium]